MVVRGAQPQDPPTGGGGDRNSSALSTSRTQDDAMVVAAARTIMAQESRPRRPPNRPDEPDMDDIEYMYDSDDWLWDEDKEHAQRKALIAQDRRVQRRLDKKRARDQGNSNRDNAALKSPGGGWRQPKK